MSLPGGRLWIRYCVNKEAVYGAVMGHLFGGAFLLEVSVCGMGCENVGWAVKMVLDNLCVVL